MAKIIQIQSYGINLDHVKSYRVSEADNRLLINFMDGSTQIVEVKDTGELVKLLDDRLGEV